MRLRFIGTGGAFCPEMGNTSAFCARGDDLFLFDCGESVFSRLHGADIFARYPGELVITITHLHADHCGSLATTCLYAAQVLGRKVTIVYPDEAIRTLLSLMGVAAERYTLVDRYDCDGVRISPMPARHAPGMPAYAYLIADEMETIYYSGDNGELSPTVLDGIRSGDIAHAYQDTNWFDAEPDAPVHLPLSRLEALVELPLRGRFTLMHFNRDFHDHAEMAGFACAKPDEIFTSGGQL